MFKQIADVQGMVSGLELIRNSEAAVRDSLNEWGPQIIEGVLAGDNIAQVNGLLDCFTGVRRTRLVRVVRRFVPFEQDKDTGEFTQKLTQKPRVEKAEKAFVDFMESDTTLYSLINDEKAKEQDEKTDEEKHEAALKALAKALARAKDCGVSYNEVQTAAVAGGYTLADVMQHLREAA